MDDNGEQFRQEMLRMHAENKDSLSDLAAKVDAMREAVHRETTEMKVNIAMLQVKCGVWGLLGGAIPVALMLIMKLLK